MEQDKVSILITNFCYSRYIDECIQSCLSQTYKNIEIIVVDDCSTDDSVEKLRTYGDKIKLFVHDKNYGYQKALNTAISHSAGEFLTPLDSDDALTIDSTEKKVKALLEHQDWMMVYSWLNYCDDKLNVFKINKKEFSLVGIEDMANVGHTMMFRRTCLNFMQVTSGQWRDERWSCHGDLEWILRFIEHAQPHLIEEPLYMVRKTNPKSWGVDGVKDGRSRSIMYEIILEATSRRRSKNMPLLPGMSGATEIDFKAWIEIYINRWGVPTNPIPDNPCRDAAVHIKGHSVLDVCCGIGHLCYYFGQEIEYTGVDAIQEFLDAANGFFPERNFVIGDLFDLSNAPMADTVFCLRTIGQDTWNQKYTYISNASHKETENMDYRLAIQQLLSRTRQRLVISMPLSRPLRVQIVKNIIQEYSAEFSMHLHENPRDEFVIIVAERKP